MLVLQKKSVITCSTKKLKLIFTNKKIAAINFEQTN